MNSIRDLLQKTDPLRGESEPSAAERSLQRQAILKAAAASSSPVPKGRSRIPAYLGIMVIAIVGLVVGLRLWAPFINDVRAAVRFEVRPAEQCAAPGLIEAKVVSGGKVYLHDEVIVANSDVAHAEVTQEPGESQYAILITFNSVGTQKMHTFTENNIGKLIAILIDGEVIAAPRVMGVTNESAKIDGKLTKEEAEKIVAGMRIK
jgi:hypothetical protein